LRGARNSCWALLRGRTWRLALAQTSPWARPLPVKRRAPGSPPTHPRRRSPRPVHHRRRSQARALGAAQAWPPESSHPGCHPARRPWQGCGEPLHPRRPTARRPMRCRRGPRGAPALSSRRPRRRHWRICQRLARAHGAGRPPPGRSRQRPPRPQPRPLRGRSRAGAVRRARRWPLWPRRLRRAGLGARGGRRGARTLRGWGRAAAGSARATPPGRLRAAAVLLAVRACRGQIGAY